ncbi:uncharacterized protein LOC143284018 [Babylonia areolata]|uniref:uncharacterized protein LOC143284018 n=1 Tax=Babylonia areolata TaxID=304850 RepID=UPI003FD5C6D7
MANDVPKDVAEEDNPDSAAKPFLAVPSGTDNMTAPTSGNEFTARKTAAHAMMDTALLMANISQLRVLLTGDSAAINFFVPLLCLIVFSILCQILFALIILVIWARETHRRAQPQPAPTPSPSDCKHVPSSPAPSPPPAATPAPDGLRRLQHRSFTRINGRVSGPQAAPAHPPSNLLHGRTVSLDMSDDTPVTSGEGDAKFDVITQRLHIVTLLLVFMITITNMFITGIGFDSAIGGGGGKVEVGLGDDVKS